MVYPLRFTNLTRVTCHLNGYPGVAAVGRHGHQLGSPASRDTLFRPRFVTLRRGATAHADLTIEEAGNFPSRACRMRTAVGLRVYPPASRGAAFVRLTFAACSRRGPSYLHVTAVHRGARLGAALVAHPPGGRVRPARPLVTGCQRPRRGPAGGMGPAGRADPAGLVRPA